MNAAADRKLFLGGRLKRLRRDLDLSQTAMAADLGVSPSYLNHIERNQRPVSAQLLLRLAETYDVDLRAFGAGAGPSEAELAEVFADPLLSGVGAPRHEILQLLAVILNIRGIDVLLQWVVAHWGERARRRVFPSDRDDVGELIEVSFIFRHQAFRVVD